MPRHDSPGPTGAGTQRPGGCGVVPALNEAIHSHDQARIDLVLAEISGLAAREARAEGSARETPGPRLHQPSLVEGRRR